MSNKNIINKKSKPSSTSELVALHEKFINNATPNNSSDNSSNSKVKKPTSSTIEDIQKQLKQQKNKKTQLLRNQAKAQKFAISKENDIKEQHILKEIKDKKRPESMNLKYKKYLLNQERLMHRFFNKIKDEQDLLTIAQKIKKESENVDISPKYKKTLEIIMDTIIDEFMIDFINSYVKQTELTLDNFYQKFIKQKDFIIKSKEINDLLDQFYDDEKKQNSSAIHEDLDNSASLVEEVIFNKIDNSTKSSLQTKKIDYDEVPTIKKYFTTPENQCYYEWVGGKIESLFIESVEGDISDYILDQHGIHLFDNHEFFYKANKNFQKLFCDFSLKSQHDDVVTIKIPSYITTSDNTNQISYKTIKVIVAFQTNNKYILNTQEIYNKEKAFRLKKFINIFDNPVTEDIKTQGKIYLSINLLHSMDFEDLKEYNPDSIFVSRVIDSLNTGSVNNFVTDLVYITVFLSQMIRAMGSKIFISRIKSYYYLPENLTSLSISEKFPEIFNNPTVTDKTKEIVIKKLTKEIDLEKKDFIDWIKRYSIDKTARLNTRSIISDISTDNIVIRRDIVEKNKFIETKRNVEESRILFKIKILMLNKEKINKQINELDTNEEITKENKKNTKQELKAKIQLYNDEIKELKKKIDDLKEGKLDDQIYEEYGKEENKNEIIYYTKDMCVNKNDVANFNEEELIFYTDGDKNYCFSVFELLKNFDNKNFINKYTGNIFDINFVRRVHGYSTAKNTRIIKETLPVLSGGLLQIVENNIMSLEIEEDEDRRSNRDSKKMEEYGESYDENIDYEELDNLESWESYADREDEKEAFNAGEAKSRDGWGDESEEDIPSLDNGEDLDYTTEELSASEADEIVADDESEIKEADDVESFEDYVDEMQKEAKHNMLENDIDDILKENEKIINTSESFAEGTKKHIDDLQELIKEADEIISEEEKSPRSETKEEKNDKYGFKSSEVKKPKEATKKRKNEESGKEVCKFCNGSGTEYKTINYDKNGKPRVVKFCTLKCFEQYEKWNYPNLEQ